MKQLALFLLRVYKRFVSAALPPSCRFTPSCSEYTYEATASSGPCVGAGGGAAPPPPQSNVSFAATHSIQAAMTLFLDLVSFHWRSVRVSGIL